MKQRTASEQVAFMARSHYRGILCPSECWRQSAYALTPATATKILDGLSPEAQEHLLAMYRNRPPIAYVHDCAAQPAGSDFRAVCVQIVNWCESQSPTVLPPEPDGIISVRVENGTVVVWQ